MSMSTRLQYSPLAAALFLAMATAMPAAAQDAVNQQKAGEPAQTLDTVSVTGSRIKRAAVEGPAPVTVITADQIRKEGFATAYDALASLTEFTGQVQGQEGWGSASNSSPLNLRGMGPGRSLLLIDGHRAPDYPGQTGAIWDVKGFQSYGNIPAAAIERIEILASGASAIYGSDAVAGVVNVVLKKNFEGNEIRLKGGASTRGGRDLFDFSYTGGTSGDKWSLVYGVQFMKRDPLFAGERDFTDNPNDANIQAWSAEQLARGNRYNMGYDAARISRTDTGQRIMPAGVDCAAYGNGSTLEDYRVWDSTTGTLGPAMGQYCSQGNLFDNWTILNGESNKSVYVRGSYDFTDSLHGYATVLANANTVTNSVGDFALGYWPGVTWYDAGIGAVVEGKRFFTRREIGDALTRNRERSYDVTLGLQGALGRFDWDAAYNHSEYKIDKYYPAVVHALMNEYYLGPQLGVDAASGQPIHRVDLNKFFAPINQDIWNQISTTGHDHNVTKADQFQFTFSGDLFEGWAGPIGFAATAEAAKQSFRLTPDPNTYTAGDGVFGGAIGNVWNSPYKAPHYGYLLGDGSRDRWAVGTEFRVPLWSQATATLAARYDDYSQTVSKAKTTYMAGLEWRPTDSLLVRGSYATSFRAPEMYQVYSKGSEGLAQRVDALRCIQNGDINNCIGANGDNEDPAVSNWYDIIITSKGSPLLEYEEGESFTYGVVWDVMDNWSLSVDYWNIELKNAISTVGEDEVLAAEAGCATGLTVTGDTYLNPNTGSAPDSEYCALMTARVHRDGPNNAITMVEVGPFNKAGMRREGIDLATRYRLATGLGNFTFALNYTNLLKASERASEASDWSNGKDGAHHGSDWHTKTRASIGWDKDNWNAMLLATRLPQRRSGNFELNGYLPAQVIYNLTAGYRITDSIGVNFAVSNLTDKVYSDPAAGDYVYYRGNPTGREVSLEYVWKFD